MFFILYVCEFPTHFSEFACPDLKLEFYWGFHSALKFHSNHLHYACLTPVIISIFSTTSSIEFGGKFRVKLHRKVFWGPKTSKTNCYGWWLLVLIGCFKRENRGKWLRFQLACYNDQAPAVQMEVTLVKLFYIEQPLRRLRVIECEEVTCGEKMQRRVWH